MNTKFFIIKGIAVLTSAQGVAQRRVDSPANSFSVSANQSVLARNSTYVGLPADYLRNDFLGNNITLPPNTVGSPYLNETFVPSKVILNDSISYGEVLRYNAYSDEIEMQKDGEISALFKRPYIKAQIQDNTFIMLDYMKNGEKHTGYFIPLISSQEGYNLYKRISKTFREGKKAESTYKTDVAPQFIDDISYFIHSPDTPSPIEIKFSKKIVFELLGEKESLKVFMKENKINFKKEEDLIELIKFRNTL